MKPHIDLVTTLDSKRFLEEVEIQRLKSVTLADYEKNALILDLVKKGGVDHVTHFVRLSYRK